MKKKVMKYFHTEKKRIFSFFKNVIKFLFSSYFNEDGKKLIYILRLYFSFEICDFHFLADGSGKFI